MGSEVAVISMISDRNELLCVVVTTTDSGIEITTTHNNVYTGKFTTYSGSGGVKKIERVYLREPFVKIGDDEIIKIIE